MVIMGINAVVGPVKGMDPESNIVANNEVIVGVAQVGSPNVTLDKDGDMVSNQVQGPTTGVKNAKSKKVIRDVSTVNAAGI